jgi:Sel1 repeat
MREIHEYMLELSSTSSGIETLRKTAEFGYIDAQFIMGVCYAEGRGVEKDEREAVRWFRKAAERGYAEALESLGACYATGKGVEKDLAEAVKWYHKSTERSGMPVKEEPKNQIKHQISEETRKATTQCKRAFACLKKDMACLCEVGSYVNNKFLFVKCTEAGDCAYRLSFGTGNICDCPIRKETFKKYGV